MVPGSPSLRPASDENMTKRSGFWVRRGVAEGASQGGWWEIPSHAPRRSPAPFCPTRFNTTSSRNDAECGPNKGTYVQTIADVGGVLFSSDEGLCLDVRGCGR